MNDLQDKNELIESVLNMIMIGVLIQTQILAIDFKHQINLNG
jgi:hypothetical protein